MTIPALRALCAARACPGRAFATAGATAWGGAAPTKSPFLKHNIARAAINGDDAVRTSFASAFAGLIHGGSVRVSDVYPLPETTARPFAKYMREVTHDVALRYKVDGKETAVMEVMPHYSRTRVESQQQHKRYMPGRTLAHVCNHYLSAVTAETDKVEAEKSVAAAAKAAEVAAQTAKVAQLGEGGVRTDTVSTDATTTEDAVLPSGRKPPSKPARGSPPSSIYTAYLRADPVHLLLLSDDIFAYDTSDKVWRAPKSAAALPGGRYGWTAPLITTFRFTADARNLRVDDCVGDPGEDPLMSDFAAALFGRMSITVVHLPLVPSGVGDDSAWDAVVTAPAHKAALKSVELRQWLHYLAHTKRDRYGVHVPEDLKQLPVFRRSAGLAIDAVNNVRLFTEKEVHKLLAEKDRELREIEEALRERDREMEALREKDRELREKAREMEALERAQARGR